MLSRVIEISLIRKIIHGNNERVEGYDVPKFQHEITSNCSGHRVTKYLKEETIAGLLSREKE
jgi:hypothetical protein